MRKTSSAAVASKRRIKTEQEGDASREGRFTNERGRTIPTNRIVDGKSASTD